VSFAVACIALFVAALGPLVQSCLDRSGNEIDEATRLTRQQALKRKISVKIVDEYVCSDDECASRDDIADSDVAEDEIEEEDEPLDLFD
jgi:hypothetical protein